MHWGTEDRKRGENWGLRWGGLVLLKINGSEHADILFLRNVRMNLNPTMNHIQRGNNTHVQCSENTKSRFQQLAFHK